MLDMLNIRGLRGCSMYLRIGRFLGLASRFTGEIDSREGSATHLARSVSVDIRQGCFSTGSIACTDTEESPVDSDAIRKGELGIDTKASNDGTVGV